MANPIALPGTNVPSGAAVSPGGAQGPTTISTDANNKATLGSDSLILVQGTAAGVAATTHTQTVSGDDPQLVPTGAVMDFAGATAPTGWLLCNGASYSTTGTYAALFAVLGYTYGGSGANFNVPDLRGRSSIGVGLGAGLTSRALAAVGGEETHQLVTGELASHTHTQNSHSHTDSGHNHSQNAHGHPDGGHAHSFYYNGQVVASGTTAQIYSVASSPGTGLNTTTSSSNIGTTTASNIASNAVITATTAVNQNAGSGTAHNTMHPFVALNKIIKT